MTSAHPTGTLKIFGWLADSDGCGHYRVMMPLRELERRGHEVAFGERMPSGVREDPGIVVGQRICLPAPTSMWRILAREGKAKLVYEMDDDLLNVDPRVHPNAAFFARLDVRQNLHDNIKLAHLVTVSTEPLAEVIRPINPNVVICPNSIEEWIFDVPVPARRLESLDDEVRIGWQGSPTHAVDWRKHAYPAVSAAMRDPRVTMTFGGTAYPHGLPAGRVISLPWTQDTREHAERVAQFDIGLAPLTHSRFNQSKSDIKFVEYSALGVPAVCSRELPYSGTVEHGKTGFLADDSAHFRRLLRDLVRSPELRREIGGDARRAAREWTITKRISHWTDAYATLL